MKIQRLPGRTTNLDIPGGAHPTVRMFECELMEQPEHDTPMLNRVATAQVDVAGERLAHDTGTLAIPGCKAFPSYRFPCVEGEVADAEAMPGTSLGQPSTRRRHT